MLILTIGPGSELVDCLKLKIFTSNTYIIMMSSLSSWKPGDYGFDFESG